MVLADVAREPLVDEPEERIASGAAAGVQGAGLRDEQGPPPAIRQAAHQVGLLRIEKKVLVEPARLVEGGAADEQDGPLERFDLPRAGVVFAALRMASEEAAAGQRGEPRGLAEDPPRRGEPLDGGLRGAVGILETRPGDGGARIREESGLQ